MAMLIYAAPDDFVTDEWLPAAPSNATSLLRAASGLVRGATSLDRYEVDDDGFPVEQKVIDAFKDATLQQATVWSKAGIDPDAGISGQEKRIASQSVPGGSVTYREDLTPEQFAKVISCLCKPALRILRDASLGSRMPRIL